MSYSSVKFDNVKDCHRLDMATRTKLAAIDTAILNSGSGYTAHVFVNDSHDGGLGVEVTARLNTMCAALANGAAHYVAPVWTNDKAVGHLGPETLAKLNAMAQQVAALRP